MFFWFQEGGSFFVELSFQADQPALHEAYMRLAIMVKRGLCSALHT